MSNYKLGELCTKNNWFTCGTTEQYGKLFEMNESGYDVRSLAVAIWVCSRDWGIEDIEQKLKEQ